MKLHSLLSIFLAVIFTFSLLTAQTKEKAAKNTSDKKSECPMHSMKADAKDAHKCADNSKDCCKKDGKMSENCSKGDKAKCDMSKSDKSKCPGMKSSETKTENGKK